MVDLPERLPVPPRKRAAALKRLVQQRMRELDELNGRIVEEAAMQLAKRDRDPTVGNIDAAIDRIRGRYAVTEDRIRNEMAALAFSNVRDFINDDGTPVRDFSLVPEQHMAAVQELVVAHSLDENEDGDPMVVRNVKIKLYDKRPALEALGRHIGMSFTEKHEHTHRIVIEDMSDDELLRIAGSSAGIIEAEEGEE